MKIVRKPIDVIAIFKREELPMPLKVRMSINKCEIVIKVDRIIKVQKLKTIGKDEILYVCMSFINNKETIYELKYLIDSFQWILFKK